MRLIDLSGKRFGYWTVLKKDKIRGNEAHWFCRCVCGSTRSISGNRLRSGESKSCRCMAKVTHGMSDSRIFNIFTLMKSRCNNRNNPSYRSYGARGIRVLWPTFEAFLDDMLDSYLEHCEKNGVDNTTIERVDGDENYCKSNCRWATRQEQSSNRKNVRYLTVGGVRLSMAEWARRVGLKYMTLRERIRQGWDPGRAVVTPSGGN